MATEKRLIDANALSKDAFHIKQWGKGIRCVVDWDDIEAAPTVDAVEVVHGRWEPELMPTGVECTGHAEMTVQALSCSVCGKCVDVSESYFSYCPNCGAKMDGDGNE